MDNQTSESALIRTLLQETRSEWSKNQLLYIIWNIFFLGSINLMKHLVNEVATIKAATNQLIAAANEHTLILQRITAVNTCGGLKAVPKLSTIKELQDFDLVLKNNQQKKEAFVSTFVTKYIYSSLLIILFIFRLLKQNQYVAFTVPRKYL